MSVKCKNRACLFEHLADIPTGIKERLAWGSSSTALSLSLVLVLQSHLLSLCGKEFSCSTGLFYLVKKIIIFRPI